MSVRPKCGISSVHNKAGWRAEAAAHHTVMFPVRLGNMPIIRGLLTAVFLFSFLWSTTLATATLHADPGLRPKCHEYMYAHVSRELAYAMTMTRNAQLNERALCYVNAARHGHRQSLATTSMLIRSGARNPHCALTVLSS